jgi:hypothetical protein
MPAISEAKLQKLRALFVKKACDKECTISRAVKTPDGSGSQTEDPVVIAVANAVVKKPSGGILQNYAFLVASQATWQIDFPFGQDIEQGDQIAVAGSSKTLIVQEVLEPESFPIATGVLVSEGA